MDYKEMYNMIQDIAQADKIKNSLEDLYLYLHEIENMMQNSEENTEAPDNHDEFLQEDNDNDINYDEYLS